VPFLPPDFLVPARAETPRFTLRSITIHDAFRDYDAVMSSRDHLWRRFGAVWGWPAEDLTPLARGRVAVSLRHAQRRAGRADAR